MLAVRTGGRQMAKQVNRRDFLRISAAGAGAGAASMALPAAAADPADPATEPGPLALTAERLTVEYAENPLGTDVGRPRLAWVLRSDRNNTVQSAYQVQVATDPVRLARGELVWDSGRVNSARSLGVVYDGPGLSPGTRYHWRVQVWDGVQVASGWSAPAWWETGRLGRPWAASWIGAAAPPPQPTVDGASWIGGPGWTLEGAPVGSRWFRAALDLSGAVRKATLVATADDNLTVHVHGREVISAMGPGNEWNSAHLRDVTEQVRAAGNRVVLAVEAANRGGPAGLLLRLIVEFTDGTTRELRTGAGWRATDTHRPDWTSPGFNDTGWPAAGVLAVYGEGPWRRDVAVPVRENPAPLLRKDFHLSAPVSRARLYISGLAYCEAHLNGRRVGDQVLDPGFTGYDKTVFYAVHDITELLRQGANTIGVTLGRGFFGLTTRNVWDWHLAKWHGEPRLLAQLEIEHLDGRRTTVGTDGSWRLTEGPTRSNSLYSGETYDARLAPQGWTSPGFQENPPWTAALVVPGPGGTLRAQPNEPIRVVETVRPTSVRELRPGVHVVDMGRTMSGWTRLTVRAPAGTRISLLHGEKLNADGSVQSQNEHVKDARQQRDEYLAAGTGLETWEPRFSYKGFRYVEVTGLPVAPRPEEVAGRVVHSDVRQVSEFRCSQPMFEQLDGMMRRTILGNLHSIPTDTPMYEKNGWTGDAQVGAPSMAYSFGMQRFFSKWMGDLADSQNSAGQVPVIVPNGGRWGYQQLAPSPEWTTVFPFLAREMHRWYGDDRIGAEHWTALTRYLDWEINRMRGGLAETALGDFLPPDSPGGIAGEDTRLTATAYLHRALISTAELGEHLGQHNTAARYRQVAGAARDALNRTFLRNGHYNSDRDNGYRQTSNAIPLAFGLVPVEAVRSVVDSLVADIRRRGDHLNTGCLGTSVLLPVLTAHGYPDVAYAIAVQRSEPSWGYWIERGADTMWEMWHQGSRSHNHYFQGTITQWFHEHVAGLRPLANGYQRILIRPDARVDLGWARTSIETVRGRAAVDWARTGTGLTLTTAVPVGATAEVHVPANAPADVIAPGGAVFLGQDNGYARYQVGSGTWTFTTSRA
ncbi:MULTISPECIES: alpha-L-rhamnosidase [unclassified Crossiella]|uniref:alpha-L-rhamnosidase n=1 Tax=unclassified Crossiella TaxID=2620835 RepID=UPI0020003725|nr:MULTISPECIES: alpha-L-rhamnosidase [unclassified Crossiella]MCK2244636.1 glycoside hydrolase family 78 protein [Crossiella sp. S99.2]MCK2258377.1 glycoside hydrolase family 78 protein [Crossiella sp. S99.1]